MDSAELNRLLLARYEDVCKHLLPNGQQKGSHYLVGNLDGEAGQSLQITTSGAAAGRFKDFKTGDCGATPLWLWSKVRKIPFLKAVSEAREFLGVKDDDFGIKRHKTKEWAMPVPADRNGTQIIEPNSKAMDYLILERRLDPLVISKAKVGESKDGEWIVLPYFDAGEAEAFHIKKFKVDRPNGKKEISASKGTRRGLYGKHLIDENTSEITITEGEIDALSLHSVGIPAVSVPSGVSDASWIEVEWDWLNRFERINVSFDMDEAGRSAVTDVCKRLGINRAHIVTLPRKDANECLVAGVTRDEFVSLIASAKQIELDEIKRAVDYTEEVYDYYETDWTKRGWETPWFPNLPWRVRKAEFTILSGFSGSGKTVGLNQLMLHLVQQGCKVMDSSLEIKPGMTIFNLTRCALGKRSATRDEIKSCHEWLNDAMFFHDCIGTVTIDRLMNAMEYARKRHGIDVFIIDSLFKCGLDPADFGSQRTFADKLTTFCNNTGAHVILVAHSRKTQNGNEFSVPSKSDVAGSSDLTNAAFNVIIWWRNKIKKRKLDEARSSIPPNNEAIADWIDQPDGKIVLDKQRFGDGDEAEVPIWFNSDSLQFHTSMNRQTKYFRLN